MTSLLHPVIWPVLLLLASPATQPADPPAPAAPDLTAVPLVTVLGIDEADQVTVQRQDGTRLQVRLACVRPPADDARRAAMVFLRNLLVGEKVWLVRAAAPAKGDAAWCVYRSPDRLFVNLEAVRQGYVDLLPEPTDPPEVARAIAYWRDQARHTNKGIWAVAAPTRLTAPPPSAPPARTVPISRDDPKAAAAKEPVAADASVVYISSSSSGKKYHRADCRSLRTGGKAIPLDEARAKYEPCKLCKPPQ